MSKLQQITYMSHSGNEFLADVMLPCPFCGSEADLLFYGNEYSKSRRVEIKCSNKECRVSVVSAGIRSDSRQVAVWALSIWNKRVAGHGA